VSYDSDIDRVEAVLLEEAKAAVQKLPGLLADPAPSVSFSPGPGDWALVFQVNFNVVKFSDQFFAQSEIRKILFKRLQKEKIGMPYPTYAVQMEQKPPA
jgi:small-conductance mechanosensitive channel